MPPNTFHPDKGGETLEAESLILPALPESVRLTRRLITACLPKWELDDLVFPCIQAVTELVTNSIDEISPKAATHAQTPETFTVHLRRTATHLFAEVSDPSPELPKPRNATEQDENGRGLALVEALADYWGWYPAGLGRKVVYAAWDLPAIPATPHPVVVNR